MKKHLSILIAACSLQTAITAQTLAPVDTSFATYTTYLKTLKQYPQIKIAKTVLDKSAASDLNVTFAQAGNATLKADVFYPKSKKAKPAVMMIHGGGWRSGDRSMEVPLAIGMANKGYVAICVDYRLSTEALYPAAINDLKNAVKWIKSNAAKYNIDTNKIAVMGCSAGGQLAALLGTTNNDPAFEDDSNKTSPTSTVQAILDIDGTLAFIHPESSEVSDKPGKPAAATLWLGVTAQENEALWQKVAPLNHVSKNTPPILFVNSSVARMHAGRNDMIKKLDAFHIYSEVHSFDDAPHPFWLFEPWAQPTVDYMAAFMKKVFKQ